ncbi:hypothetical protein ACCS91_33780 [Rhizobium ruizarguesonis]
MSTTYRLGSNEAVYAPGIVKWAIGGYWHEPDQPQLRTVIANGWKIPEEAAHELLSQRVPYTMECETLVFTVGTTKKDQFLGELRERLIENYDWARTPRLQKFIESMSTTIDTDRNVCNLDGGCILAAYRAVGGKGKLTYKALRTLLRTDVDASALTQNDAS